MKRLFNLLKKKILNLKTYVFASVTTTMLSTASITYAADTGAGTTMLDLATRISNVVYMALAFLGAALVIAGFKSVVMGRQQDDAAEKGKGLGMIVAGAILMTLKLTTGWIWAYVANLGGAV